VTKRPTDEEPIIGWPPGLSMPIGVGRRSDPEALAGFRATGESDGPEVLASACECFRVAVTPRQQWRAA